MAEIAASALTGYLTLVQELGWAPESLLERAGIPSAALDDPSARISYASSIQLLEITAEAIGCQDFGLRLSAYQDLSILGPLAVAAQNSRTLGEAFAVAANYFYVHTPGVLLSLQDADGTHPPRCRRAYGAQRSPPDSGYRAVPCPRCARDRGHDGPGSRGDSVPAFPRRAEALVSPPSPMPRRLQLSRVGRRVGARGVRPSHHQGREAAPGACRSLLAPPGTARGLHGRSSSHSAPSRIGHRGFVLRRRCVVHRRAPPDPSTQTQGRRNHVRGHQG